MTFQFRPAVRTETSLLIGIAGASGSGKTFSSLRLATGLAGDGKIAIIDTEAGRALHYAGQFKFDHGELKPPFTPQAYQDAIIAADQAGYRVIMVDSMSHEYEGEGGIVEWADRLSADMKPPKNWTEPKAKHKRMVGRLLQCRAHLIFCMRAEDKIKITKDDRGKMVIIQPQDIPVRDRWIPICEKRWMYEMTVSMVLTPDAPGIPVPIKVQDQHRFAFPNGQPIDERSGQSLAEWAKGGVPRETAAPVPSDELMDLARSAAGGGTDVLKTFWTGLTPAEQHALKEHLPQLKSDAAESDRAADARASEPAEEFPGDRP